MIEVNFRRVRKGPKFDSIKLNDLYSRGLEEYYKIKILSIKKHSYD